MLFTSFVANVLIINIKRLFFKLRDEKTNFNINIKKYHVHDINLKRKFKMFRNKAYDEFNLETIINDENNS